MKKKIAKAALLSFIVIGILLVSANHVKKRAWSFHEQLALPDELNYLPSNKTIKLLSLGFDEVVADYYWLKVIQHFGDQKNFNSERLRRLYPLLDLITDLAPDFEYAYRFGHIALTLKNENEDDSIKLLKKGMINRPDVWQLPYYIGFNYWFIKNQPALAAIFYEEAAKRAPSEMQWLHLLAARMMAESSNPEISITILENMINQQSVTGSGSEKQHFEKVLKLAYMERDIKNLDGAVEKFRKNEGVCPQNLSDLMKRNIIHNIPIEPHGGEYSISKDCRIFSTGTSERLHAYK